jgi:hypothetical protein
MTLNLNRRHRYLAAKYGSTLELAVEIKLKIQTVFEAQEFELLHFSTN